MRAMSSGLPRRLTGILATIFSAVFLPMPENLVRYDALLAEMGLQQFCQHVETFDLDLLVRQVSQLLAERSRYVDLIRQGNLSLRERLRRQDKILETRFVAASAPRS